MDVNETTILHSFDLLDVLSVRSPGASPPSVSEGPPLADHVDQSLRELAKALRTHASEILVGDFKIFEQLSRLVKARAKSFREGRSSA